MSATRDFIVVDYGSTVSFLAVSKPARDWMTENVQAEGWQYLGRRLVVDHRPAQNLLDGILAEGFSVVNG